MTSIRRPSQGLQTRHPSLGVTRAQGLGLYKGPATRQDGAWSKAELLNQGGSSRASSVDIPEGYLIQAGTQDGVSYYLRPMLMNSGRSYYWEYEVVSSVYHNFGILHDTTISPVYAGVDSLGAGVYGFSNSVWNYASRYSAEYTGNHYSGSSPVVGTIFSLVFNCSTKRLTIRRDNALYAEITVASAAPEFYAHLGRQDSGNADQFQRRLRVGPKGCVYALPDGCEYL